MVETAYSGKAMRRPRVRASKIIICIQTQFSVLFDYRNIKPVPFVVSSSYKFQAIAEIKESA